jgi:hypothetical protein
MKGKILRGLAALTLVITVMVIALMVTGASAHMHKGGMRGGGSAGMPCPMEQGMMGPGKGMMGHGMHKMGQCMGMMGPGVNVEVKKQKDGVTITYSSDDEKTAKKLQIMAEMMRLRREMMELESE